MGERGGWMFIALCILLIESLFFLLALHCLYCSTSVSWALAHSNKQMQWVDGHLFLVFIHDMLDFQQYFPFICFFIT